MRVRNPRPMNSDRPFQGEGYSYYMNVNTGNGVQYRKIRLVPRRRRRRRNRGWVKGPNNTGDISKTTRIASNSVSPITFAIPNEFASQANVISDIRHYKDDVENESSNNRTVSFALDGAKDIINEILGTGTILSQEQRDGGVMRLRLMYVPSREGIQPFRFRAIATAGPTSTNDATVLYNAKKRIFVITTEALSDASPYTYTIQAENQAQTVTKALVTGLSVQADASGPPAAVTPLIEDW